MTSKTSDTVNLADLLAPALPSMDSLDRELKRRARLAAFATLFLAVSIGGWAIATPLTTAVIAAGQVVVEGHAKKVQHPYGGVVSQIFVKNGDTIEKDQILITIDRTQIQANVDMLWSQYLDHKARVARLVAERDSDTQLTAPADVPSSPAWTAALESETKVFATRLAARRGQREQLGERVKQLEIEISNLEAQAQTRASETAMLETELDRVEKLYDRKLLPETRVLSLRRELVRLAAERNALLAQASKSKAAIAETELQIIGIERTTQADASRELSDVEARLGDIREKLAIATDQLKRVELRAPVSGVVHELQAHTVGGVIAPAETLMAIVPEGTPLAVETRVSPTDIDQIAMGQEVRVKFTAFNQRTTPEIKGVVSRIAPDVSKDPLTGATYYAVHLAVDRTTTVPLVPGMPVEAHITGAQRTPITYLSKPLMDSLNRALSEE